MQKYFIHFRTVNYFISLKRSSKRLKCIYAHWNSIPNKTISAPYRHWPCDVTTSDLLMITTKARHVASCIRPIKNWVGKCWSMILAMLVPFVFDAFIYLKKIFYFTFLFQIGNRYSEGAIMKIFYNFIIFKRRHLRGQMLNYSRKWKQLWEHF